MIDRKNRYGRTAARIHDADGLARRPPSVTIDIHAHIVVPKPPSWRNRTSTSAESRWHISRTLQPEKSTRSRRRTSAKS